MSPISVYVDSPLAVMIGRFVKQRPDATYLALPIDCPRADNLDGEHEGYVQVVVGGRCGMVLPHVPFPAGSGVMHLCLLAPGHSGRCGWATVADGGCDEAWVQQIDPVARIRRAADYARGIPDPLAVDSASR